MVNRKANRGSEPLSSQEAQFVGFYLASLNGADSARKAGYKHPSQASHRLLSHPKIKRVLNKALNQIDKKLELTVDDILTQLHHAVMRTSDDILDENGHIPENLRDISERAKNCIDGVEQTSSIDMETGEKRVKTKLKLMSKGTALELAMKAKGMFAPKKIEGEIVHRLDWDSLKSPPPKDTADDIEALIADPKLLPPPSPELRYTPSEIIEGEIVE